MTFTAMRNRILDDLDRTDLTAVAEREISSAIDFYERRRFWFMEQRSTSTTISGQEFYGLPNDFRDDDSLVITINQNTYPLIKRSYQQTEDWFIETDNFTGQPSDYAIYDEQLRLYPIPNGVYQLVLSYIKQVGTPEADDDNEWTTEAEALIRYHAEAVINAAKLRRFDAAAACRELAATELSQHEKLTKARLFTGHTRKRGTWR